MRVRRLVLASTLLALLVPGCGGTSDLGGPPADALATISVTPNPGSAVVGGTIQFIAEGHDATGAVVPISPAPTWSVVAGGGTINSSSGLFTAGTVAGTFTSTVRATSGGISGFATAIVTAPGTLTTITVTPNPGSAAVGGTIQFIAEGHDATGAVVPISPTPTWSVVAGGGTINSSTGLFTAGATPGTFDNTVRATSGGISGFATAIVTAATLWQGTVTATGPNFLGPSETFTTEVAFELDTESNNGGILFQSWRIRTGTVAWHFEAGPSKTTGCPLSAPDETFTLQPTDGSLTIVSDGQTTRYSAIGALVGPLVEITQSCPEGPPQTISTGLEAWLLTGGTQQVLTTPGVISGTYTDPVNNHTYQWNFTQGG